MAVIFRRMPPVWRATATPFENSVIGKPYDTALDKWTKMKEKSHLYRSLA